MFISIVKDRVGILFFHGYSGWNSLHILIAQMIEVV